VSGQRGQIVRCLGLADEPVQDRLDGASALPEEVVVEAFGELESSIRIVESALVSPCPREAAMDERLQRGARRRVTQCFFEELRGRVVRLELRQENQRLGPPRTDLLLTQ
jgi:hypothetical protein